MSLLSRSVYDLVQDLLFLDVAIIEAYRKRKCECTSIPSKYEILPTFSVMLYNLERTAYPWSFYIWFTAMSRGVLTIGSVCFK